MYFSLEVFHHGMVPKKKSVQTDALMAVVTPIRRWLASSAFSEPVG